MAFGLTWHTQNIMNKRKTHCESLAGKAPNATGVLRPGGLCADVLTPRYIEVLEGPIFQPSLYTPAQCRKLPAMLQAFCHIFQSVQQCD
jgi:hypothetical protein